MNSLIVEVLSLTLFAFFLLLFALLFCFLFLSKNFATGARESKFFRFRLLFCFFLFLFVCRCWCFGRWGARFSTLSLCSKLCLLLLLLGKTFGFFLSCLGIFARFFWLNITKLIRLEVQVLENKSGLFGEDLVVSFMLEILDDRVLHKYELLIC